MKPSLNIFSKFFSFSTQSGKRDSHSSFPDTRTNTSAVSYSKDLLKRRKEGLMLLFQFKLFNLLLATLKAEVP